jgi:predicted enzyme related to lactoylglutathione lyase
LTRAEASHKLSRYAFASWREQPSLLSHHSAPLLWRMDRSPVSLVEFPADNPERALRFWQGVIDVEFEARKDDEEEGSQTRSDAAKIGVHKRGTGPGDTFSLPYLMVDDMASTLQRVIALDGTVVHPGEHFAICEDSEGNPFGSWLTALKTASQARTHQALASVQRRIKRASCGRGGAAVYGYLGLTD